VSESTVGLVHKQVEHRSDTVPLA